MRVVGGVDAYPWDSMPDSGGVVSDGCAVCESVSTEDGGVAELIRIGNDPRTWSYVSVLYTRHELPAQRRRVRLSSYSTV